jgi:hypothetical protein
VVNVQCLDGVWRFKASACSEAPAQLELCLLLMYCILLMLLLRLENRHMYYVHLTEHRPRIVKLENHQ